MEALSNFVARGDLHLACVAVSLIHLLWRATLRARGHYFYNHNGGQTYAFQLGVRREPRRRLRFAFAAPQTIAVGAALSLSIFLGLRHSAWKEQAALGYLFLLSTVRLVGSSPRKNVYHSLNAVALAISILDIIESILPLAILGSHRGPAITDIAKLACIIFAFLIPFVTPRYFEIRDKETSSPEEASLESGIGKLSPEETCSWFSFYFYEWLTYLILRGFSRTLTIQDLPSLPAYDAPLLWLQRLEAARLKGGKMFWTLSRVFKNDIRDIMVWAAVTGVVEYTAAFSMYHLLSFLEQDSGVDNAVVNPFAWVSLLFLGPMLRSVCYQRAMFVSTRLLVKAKMLVIQEIYHKMLWSRAEGDSSTVRKGNDSLQEGNNVPKDDPKQKPSTSVKLESLVSYDADMVSNGTDMFYSFTASATSTAVAMTFLYQMLGWPSLLGVVTLVFLTPLPALSSKRLSRMHRFVMEVTDARLSRISEYLHSIRTIKYFAWEDAAASDVNRVRDTEQGRIWRRNVTSMLVSMTGDMLSLVSLLVMFTTLVLFTDRTLHASTAFTSLAITETLRSQFVWLSKVAQWVAQARESAQRIDDFLHSAVEKRRHPVGPPRLVNATFCLSPSSSPPSSSSSSIAVQANSTFCLRDLSISFRDGGLNIITGPTGSGKTSVLLSLLGETDLEVGRVTCPAEVAYVPQTAWLQNSTVRQNILFYSPFDEARYDGVLRACDLVDDLAQLPLGDLTQVGECGSTLSGGQKQRVSLARALYSPAATLLLDDIFSALDTHTTSRIYQEVFEKGLLLAGRTVILVTHLKAAVDNADMVVRLEHGAVASTMTREEGSPRQPETSGIINGSSTIPKPDQAPPETSPDLNPNPAVFQGSLPSTELLSPHWATKASVPEPDGSGHQEQQASGRVPRTMSE